MTTNLNSGYFSAYQSRHKPANIIRRTLSAQRSHRIDSNSSIFIVDRNNDRILRRNDFANNQLFLTKQKLTRILSKGQTPSAESTDELLNLFDRHRSNPETTPNEKSSKDPGKESQLSIVNLPMRSRPQREQELMFLKKHLLEGGRFSAVQWVNPDIVTEENPPPVRSALQRLLEEKEFIEHPFYSSLTNVKSLLASRSKTASLNKKTDEFN